MIIYNNNDCIFLKKHLLIFVLKCVKVNRLENSECHCTQNATGHELQLCVFCAYVKF
jgi:hypothetical protein